MEAPLGWKICDGKPYTRRPEIKIPDLRNKFIIGAGGLYNLGDTGGSHEVTLKHNQVPNHYHEVFLKLELHY